MMLKNRFLTLLAILTLLTMLFTTQSGYAQGLHKHLHTQKHQQVYNDKKSDDGKDSFIQYDIRKNPVLDAFKTENKDKAANIYVGHPYVERKIGRIKYQIANIVGTPLKATISESSDGEITYPREIFRCFATHLEVAETICPESLEEEKEMIYSYLTEGGRYNDFEELPDFKWRQDRYISPYDRSKKTEKNFGFDNKDVEDNENGKDRYKVSIDGVYKDVLREQQAAGYRTSTVEMSSYKYYERVFHMRPMESYTVRLYQGQFTYSVSGSPLYQKTSENSLAGTTKGWFYNPLPKTGRIVTPTQPRVDLYYRRLGAEFGNLESLKPPLKDSSFYHAFVIITDPYGDEYYIGGGPSRSGTMLINKKLRSQVGYWGNSGNRVDESVIDNESRLDAYRDDYYAYTTLEKKQPNLFVEKEWSHDGLDHQGFFNAVLAAFDFSDKVNNANITYHPTPTDPNANSNSVAFQAIEHIGFNRPVENRTEIDFGMSVVPGHDVRINIPDYDSNHFPELGAEKKK